MVVVVKLLEIPPTCCHYYYSNKIKSITGSNNNSQSFVRFVVDGGKRRRSSTTIRVSIRRTTTTTTSNAADTPRVIDNNKNNNSNNYNYNYAAAAAAGVVDIPISCFQLIGVPDQAEKDEIVKSVMHLKNSEIEEGYTMDAVVSRQNLLMDVRDKLLFEPEYAGNTREKVPPKSSLRIPWAWLPGALCLLQEVGEEKLVLDIGRSALNHANAKLYVHDLLLSMALAECAIAKISFENNKISQGFEALARTQCLLRSKVSLERMPLLSQIEESLEELAPACTLEILGIPHTPENAERRLGAIAALRELLRQGLDVETSCQVQDWPCFLYQALKKLMAIEIVELLPWDNLASTRKNKKSIESQNQRVIIDCNCFYLVLIAHIALGFSSKKIDLITKAKIICDSLIASEGIDLKFEESLCSFLLGQGDESTVSERLRQLNSISNSTSRNLISGKELKDVPSANQSLESWIKDTMLVLFPDTMDCSSSLDNFFVGEKKGGNWQNKKAPQTQSSMRLGSISHPPSDRRAYEVLDSFTNTSQNLGTAVKQLASSNLQGPAVAINANSGGNGSSRSVQLKRNLGARHCNFWDIVFGKKDHGGNIVVITALGCIFLLMFKLMGMQLRRITSGLASNKPWTNSSSHSWTTDSSLGQRWGPACIKGSSIARWLKKLLSTELLSTEKMHLRSLSEAETLQKSSLDGSHLFPKTAVYKRQMHMEEAETLVKQWQTIKAEALGPNHQVQSLFEVLDEPMLIQWQALADTAQTKSCFWKFVLLQLSILRAEILSDEIGNEMAEIEAFLEEAAELVDGSQQKNPNYYSTYTIRYVLKRQEDGSWRFCEGDIQTTS